MTNEERLQQMRDCGVEAVEILGSHLDDDCAAVRKLEGQKFTVDTVPRLPLPECDSANCMCIYIATTTKSVKEPTLAERIASAEKFKAQNRARNKSLK